MDFRLNRLILIDSYCRNRIVELDLSSHITINGENGAGKTTLLRLLPIFFGESPSKIIRGDAVVDKFGRYYFPTTASYVVFEYQRRNQTALAVVHADGQSDKVAYRFIDSEYRPELFKNGNALVQAGELHRHLEKMGVTDSKPLPMHAYRQIIQNTAGREYKHLAARFSFTGGTGKLTHMERIVTGILQRATTFFDLKKMIVSSILDDDQGFSLRTSRRDLLHWVSEYEAHYAVMEKTSAMSELEQLDQQRRITEAEFSKVHARFHLLHDHHQDQVILSEKAEDAAKTDKNETERAYDKQLRELGDKKRDAETLVNQATTAISNLDGRRTRYDQEQADEKAGRVDSVPALQLELDPLQKHYKALQDKVASITDVFDSMEKAAKEQASNANSLLSTARGDAYKAANDYKEELAKQHKDSLSVIQKRQEKEREAAEQKVSKLRVDEGKCDVELRNVQADPAVLESLEAARGVQNDAAGKLEKLHERTQGLQRTWEKHKAVFEDLELQIANGEVAIEKIQEECDKLLAADNAGEDTLLGFLRRNKSEWVSDIGRIVSEDMLLRTDLSPELTLGTDLFGISIDLEKLNIGRFASEDALRQSIKMMRSKLESRSREVTEDRAKLGEKHIELNTAKTSINQHDAEISIAKNAKEKAVEEVKAAKRRVAESKSLLAARAQHKLADCSASLRSSEDELNMIKRDHRDELNRVENAHSLFVAEANNKLEEEMASIKKQGIAIDADLKEKIEKISADRSASLRDKGISPDILNSIAKQINTLERRIAEANGLRSFVSQYRDWLKDSWAYKPVRQQELQSAKTELNRHSRDLESLKKERDTVLAQKSNAITQASDLVDKHSRIQRSAKAQMNELSVWPKDQSTLDGGFDQTSTVELLAAERKRLQDALVDCREKIRLGVEDIRRQMCKEVGTGPERFHANALKETGYPRHGKEHEWIEVFRTWFNDRHTENRNSLSQLGKTMAQNISSFWRDLDNFKRKVATFSTDLKSSLDQGQLFESIADVTTDIRTHVDTQNYWDVVENLHLEYDAWHTMGDTALPPPSFVAAAKNVALILSEEKGLVADPVDLISLKISANVNGQGSKTASNEHELANMSSNGLSYIILCVVLIGFVNRIRRKESVGIPFVIDELKDLSYSNAKTLLDLLNRNNITMISAFPDVDLDLAELFSRNYKILPGREVGLINLESPESDEDEDEVAHV